MTDPVQELDSGVSYKTNPAHYVFSIIDGGVGPGTNIEKSTGRSLSIPENGEQPKPVDPFEALLFSADLNYAEIIVKSKRLMDSSDPRIVKNGIDLVLKVRQIINEALGVENPGEKIRPKPVAAGLKTKDLETLKAGIAELQEKLDAGR